MPVKHFEDLEVWKEARLFTQRIYQLTRGAKFSKEARGQVRSWLTLYCHVSHKAKPGWEEPVRAMM
jgi:hypothetical protein